MSLEYHPKFGNTKEEITKNISERINKFNWIGPGWYYLDWRDERCSRNCCNEEYCYIFNSQEYLDLLNDNLDKINYIINYVKDRIPNNESNNTNS